MQKEDEEQRYCTLFHIFYNNKKVIGILSALRSTR